MFKIKKIEIIPLSIPFKNKVTTTWSIRGGTTIFLIKTQLQDNTIGYGEVVGFFDSDIMLNSLKKMVNQINFSKFKEVSKNFQRAIYNSSWMRTGRMNDLGAACWAGIETSLYSAFSKKIGCSIPDLFGGILNDKFEVAVNISHTDLKDFKKKINFKKYINIFIKLAKNHVSLNEDLKCLRSIKKINKKIGICLDVNGAWSINTAISALNEINKMQLNIKCIEQPVMEPILLKKIKEQSKYPIGINEILNNPQSIISNILSGTADIFVLDIFECGGLRNMFFLCKTLEMCGLQVMCRAHGSPSISYITSLGILSTTNASCATTPMQIYDFDDKQSLINWKPTINSGLIHVNDNDFNFEINEKNIKLFNAYYKKGIRYQIYTNKNKKVIPKFPKY